MNGPEPPYRVLVVIVDPEGRPRTHGVRSHHQADADALKRHRKLGRALSAVRQTLQTLPCFFEVLRRRELLGHPVDVDVVGHDPQSSCGSRSKTLTSGPLCVTFWTPSQVSKGAPVEQAAARFFDEHREELETMLVQTDEQIRELDDRLAHHRAERSRILAALGRVAPDGRELGQPAFPDPLQGPITLHEAMAVVLQQNRERVGDDYGMTAPNLSKEVTRQQLYRRRDGAPPGVQQIHARVGNYPHLFEKRNGRIFLNMGGTPEALRA